MFEFALQVLEKSLKKLEASRREEAFKTGSDQEKLLAVGRIQSYIFDIESAIDVLKQISDGEVVDGGEK